MTTHGRIGPGLAIGVLLLGATTVAAKALAVAMDRVRTRPPAPAEDDDTPLPVAAAGFIDAEAGVFRLHPDMLATGDPFTARRNANPRTLHSFRARRDYPGAPPRIPHGLTTTEFRAGTCNSCHERGGFAPRFGAYAPVTPHPDFDGCLQCHVGDDEVIGVPLPSRDPNSICRQCHDPAGLARGSLIAGAWPATAWPRLALKRPDHPPPPIPHDLQLRGNCVACHAGPGAVAEIRTEHPERANCRQCHLAEETS